MVDLYTVMMTVVPMTQASGCRRRKQHLGDINRGNQISVLLFGGKMKEFKMGLSSNTSL